MTNVACKGVTPQTLGFNAAEVSQLRAVDRTIGDDDGIVTVAEYDAFLARSMRSPAQTLPRESWVRRTLQGTHDAGRCGVALPPPGATVPGDGKMQSLLIKTLHNGCGDPANYKWFMRPLSFVTDPFEGRRTFDVSLPMAHDAPLTAAVIPAQDIGQPAGLWIIVRDDRRGIYYDGGPLPM